jgi:hypothetical protein
MNQDMCCCRRSIQPSSSEPDRGTASNLTNKRSLCEDDITFSTDEQGRRAILGSGAYGKVWIRLDGSGFDEVVSVGLCASWLSSLLLCSPHKLGSMTIISNSGFLCVNVCSQETYKLHFQLARGLEKE